MAKERPRLGRGLNALISSLESGRTSSAEAEVRPFSAIGDPKPVSEPGNELLISEIAANPHQPRRSWDDASLAALAESIRSSGVIQPILVRRSPDGAGSRFELIAGERRLRAAKLAGRETIPAIVREADSFQQAELALIENIQREDLNVLERATAYRTLMDQLGLTQGELATRLSEDRSSIANHLRLLELAEPVKAYVRDGKLSLGHAKLLAGVADVLEQDRLAQLVVSQDLSVRNLERLIQAPGPTPPRQKRLPSAHLDELEKTFSGQMGMRVQIHASGDKGRGRLVIHYNSLDQFDQVVGRLGIILPSE